MKYLLLSLFFLAACYPRRHLPAPEEKAVAVAIQAWKATEPYKLKNCALDDITVLHARDAREFKEWCFIEPDHVASCFNPNWHKVVLSPTQQLEPDGEPIIHEMLHWFIICESSGLDADADHKRPDVWRAHGPYTVQSAANKLYQE